MICVCCTKVSLDRVYRVCDLLSFSIPWMNLHFVCWGFVLVVYLHWLCFMLFLCLILKIKAYPNIALVKWYLCLLCVTKFVRTRSYRWFFFFKTSCKCVCKSFWWIKDMFHQNWKYSNHLIVHLRALFLQVVLAFDDETNDRSELWNHSNTKLFAIWFIFEILSDCS